MRRILLSLTVSVAVHLLMVAIAVGFGVWQAISLTSAIKIQTISVEVKELPLGAPPAQATEDDEKPPPRAPRPRHRVATAHEGVIIPAAPDAGAPPSKHDAA